MTYKIELTDQAGLNLINLYEYLAFTLQELKNAGGQLDCSATINSFNHHRPQDSQK